MRELGDVRLMCWIRPCKMVRNCQDGNQEVDLVSSSDGQKNMPDPLD